MTVVFRRLSALVTWSISPFVFSFGGDRIEDLGKSKMVLSSSFGKDTVDAPVNIRLFYPRQNRKVF